MEGIKLQILQYMIGKATLEWNLDISCFFRSIVINLRDAVYPGTITTAGTLLLGNLRALVLRVGCLIVLIDVCCILAYKQLIE
jgi:hypothetical protein